MAIQVPMDDALEVLEDRIFSLRKRLPLSERILIALSGVPGSGKSTVAAALIHNLHSVGIDDIAVVPMDGFHYAKRTLASFNNAEEAFTRRGAPFTFDASAFIAAVQALANSTVARSNDTSEPFKLPSFSHSIQDPVKDDICISYSTRVVILEGNYTLLDHSPWDQIASMVHERWFVSIPRAVAKDRLIKRHLAAGIERNVDAAEARAEANDLLNGDLIMDKLIAPHVTIRC